MKSKFGDFRVEEREVNGGNGARRPLNRQLKNRHIVSVSRCLVGPVHLVLIPWTRQTFLSIGGTIGVNGSFCMVGLLG